MAREYAQNRIAMWNDDHFRQLSDGAQNLYNYLLAHPTTTYAGVVDWRPARLQSVNVSWTAARVRELGDELEREHYIVIDEDTEEVAIRSFLRWESVLKSPNLARACAKAFQVIQSRLIRGVLVFEMDRLRVEHPDWAAWELYEIDELSEGVEPIDAKQRTLRGTLPETLPETLPAGGQNPFSKGSAITSNKQQVTGTPITGTSNPSTRVENAATGDESEESRCKRQLLSLRVDYDKVRTAISKKCGRIPGPSDVVRIAVGILAKTDEEKDKPTAYIVTSIGTDWAQWQKFLDEEGAA